MVNMSDMAVSDFIDDEGNFRPVGDVKTRDGYTKLSLLVKIVYSKHFLMCGVGMDEMLAVGMLKALELLKGGGYDPQYSLKNYLYSGIRNALTNHLYHQRKVYLALEDDLVGMVDKVIPCQETVAANLSAVQILNILKKAWRTRYLKSVLSYFKGLGFSFSDIENKEVQRAIDRSVSCTDRDLDKMAAYVCWSVF